MEHNTFKDYCTMMYQECKAERRKHNEPEITYREYVTNNNKMLLKDYARKITN